MQGRNYKVTELTCLVKVAGRAPRPRGAQAADQRQQTQLCSAWCWLGVALPFALTLLPTPQPLRGFTLGHPAPLDRGSLHFSWGFGGILFDSQMYF